jgi:Leucine-rich repeat (LRR) protein
MTIKNIFFYLIIANIGFLQAQYTTIPDTNFEQALIDLGIDTENVLDNQILTTDILNVTKLDVNNKQIFDFTGIEAFVNLEYLYCYDNWFINSLDFSNNINLKVLNCSDNNIDSLDISNLTQLIELDCSINILTELDLSDSINLTTLKCGDNSLSNINVSNNVQLINLICDNNWLTKIDLLNNIALETLAIGNTSDDTFPQNSLTTINLTNNINLNWLYASYLFELNTLDLTTNNLLISVQVNNCNITSLSIANNSLLEYLDIFNSNVENLDLRNGTNNLLISMNATNNPNLFCISVDNENDANSAVYPYSEWFIDSQVSYSSNCVLDIVDNILAKVSIYPNVVNDFLYFNNINVFNTINVKLYTVLGKEVLNQKLETNKIDLSNLNNGVWFLKIETDKGSIVKKIIKK